MKKILLIVIMLFFLISCSSTVEQRMPKSNLRLRDYNDIVVNLVNSSGSISLSTASIGDVNSAQLMIGDSQSKMALESLQFELMGIGFNFVSNSNEADAIVEFMIGSIRYDPLVGWIADQAFVKFIDNNTKEILAIFNAKGQFITPTVNNIIEELVKSIKQNF